MNKEPQYSEKIRKAAIGDRLVTVRSLNPVFTDDFERMAQKKKIESGLYNIFVKYIEN